MPPVKSNYFPLVILNRQRRLLILIALSCRFRFNVRDKCGVLGRGFTEESPQIGLEGGIWLIVSPSIRLPSRRHPEELAMLVMDAQRNVFRVPEVGFNSHL